MKRTTMWACRKDFKFYVTAVNISNIYIDNQFTTKKDQPRWLVFSFAFFLFMYVDEFAAVQTGLFCVDTH